jgi:hypothetical protein
MNFDSNDQAFRNDLRSLVNDSSQFEIRRRHVSPNQLINEANGPENLGNNSIQHAQNDNADNQGGIIPVLTGILPLQIEGIDERDIYTRFTSSELARYTINLLKERIHLLRLIFTMFVLIFTNLTNLLILLPSKHRHDFTFWEVTLNYIIYITPVVQLNWFILLVFGRNNSNYYYSLKFTIIGLTSVTSIIAYFGVLEDDIFQM